MFQRLLKKPQLLLWLLILTGLVACNRPGTLIERMEVLHSLPPAWNEIEPGLERTTLNFKHIDDGRKMEIIAIRVDPARYEFRLLCASLLLDQPAAYLADIHRRSRAMASINGGFFQPNYQPTGLVIIEGKSLHPYNPHGASGILRISEGRPEIVWAKQYKIGNPPDPYALQVGPLLIEPGRKFGMRSNGHHYKHRSALCMDDEGRSILICSKRGSAKDEPRAGLDLYELAKILYAEPAQGGLGCSVALNMDGGPSAQLQVTHQAFEVGINGEGKIRNAIAVFARGD